MKRVRYTRTESGTLVSKPLIGTKDLYTVTIIPSTLTYIIVDGNGALLFHGTETTLPRVKARVKNILKVLGVNFYDEIRNRRDSNSS